MRAARLYGAKDIRLEDIPTSPDPQKGQALLKIKAVGICGSDLHMYQDGRIGDTAFSHPWILGHEFMGEVTALGEAATDGNHIALKVGQRVAVDPACPCYHCELCEQGHPNLCPNHTFYGGFPTNGALQDSMIVNARNCFPIPDSISDGGGTLLETLGVAIHALDLAHLKISNSVAVIGCGPVGMLILRLAKLAGASEIYATDCFPWRIEKACKWGATEAWIADEHSADRVLQATNGRGVDVVIEAAWADHSVQQAADMARCGGRVVLVGIPGDDNLQMQHSTARRKGLTVALARRMKHTYPRALQLATPDKVDLDDLISEYVTLEGAPDAFERNLRYEEGIHKIVIRL